MENHVAWMSQYHISNREPHVSEDEKEANIIHQSGGYMVDIIYKRPSRYYMMERKLTEAGCCIYAINASSNGLVPIGPQAITDLLSKGWDEMKNNLLWSLIRQQQFWFRKMHIITSSTKLRPFVQAPMYHLSTIHQTLRELDHPMTSIYFLTMHFPHQNIGLWCIE